jgi:hypothetical protein
MIIGLSGKINSGKSTAADWIKEQYPQYEIISFASKLKELVATLTGSSLEDQYSREGKAKIQEGQNYSNGKCQQLLGQFCRETFGQDVWVNILLKNPCPYKIIPDVRYVNEVEAIQKTGGIVIRIERENIPLDDGRDPTHPSETALDDYEFTHVIDNNGDLDMFKKQLFEIVKVEKNNNNFLFWVFIFIGCVYFSFASIQQQPKYIFA